MNKLFKISLLLLLFSCSTDKIEVADAKSIVENTIKELDNSNFERALNNYTDDFKSSKEERINQFTKLKQALGNVSSFQLTDSVQEANIGEPVRIYLTYKIIHSKLVSTEKFTVLKEEGSLKISDHFIKSGI